MSFSLKQKALHFSTADLNTLNKGLHPAHMAEREIGKQNEPEPELNPNWLLAGLGLPAACFTPPSPPLLPAPGRPGWALLGLAGPGGQGLVPLPWGQVPDAMVFSRHHLPWHSAAA